MPTRKVTRKKKADPNKPAYQKIYETFYDETRRWTTDERDMALFLIGGPQRVTEGLYCLFPEDAAAKLGAAWPIERVEAAMVALERRGWLLRDDGWVMIVNALRWDQPGGPSQLTGAVRRVNGAPRKSRLWDAFLAACRLWATDLYTQLTGEEIDEENDPDPRRAFEEVISRCVAAADGERTDSRNTPSGHPENAGAARAFDSIVDTLGASTSTSPASDLRQSLEHEPELEPEFEPEPGAEAEFERLRLLEAEARGEDLFRVIGGGESLSRSASCPPPGGRGPSAARPSSESNGLGGGAA